MIVNEPRFSFKWYIKWIIIGICIVVFLGATLFGATASHLDSFDFNTSEIPISKQIDLNITLIQNGTLFIDRVDNEDRLNIQFPNQTYFNATENETILFNVSVNRQFFENTTLIAIFNLSSNINNNTFLYSIVANALYDESLVSYDGENFLTLVKGNFIRNITTNLLPVEWDSFDFKIYGPSETTMEISCPPGWLECPPNATFNTNNISRFEIPYTVPKSAPIGRTTYKINFTLDNISENTKVIFNIKKPDYSFENYVFEERCFKKSKDGDLLVTYDCMKEKENFDHQQQLELIDYLKKEYAEYNESCEEPEVRYILKGNIEDSIWISYETCVYDLNRTRGELNIFRDDLDYCEHERKVCNLDLGDERTKYSECEQELLNNTADHLADTFQTSVDNELKARKIRNSVIKSVFLILGVVAFFVGLIWYYFHWKNKYHTEVLLK